MEDFVFRIIWRIAKQSGCTGLLGSYVRSAKNAVVAGLYQRLGGAKIESATNDAEPWWFDLAGAEPAGTPHIADISGSDQMQDLPAFSVPVKCL